METEQVTGTTQEQVAHLASKLQSASANAQLALMKEAIDFLDDYYDPKERFFDDPSGPYYPIGHTGPMYGQWLYTNWAELDECRRQSRHLAAFNEFAINGHENRVSYTIGWGHTYTAVSKQGMDAGEDEIASVQMVVDEWIKRNKWHKRQQEMMRRLDRDGECFIHITQGDDGTTLRFIEPEHIKNPDNVTDNAHIRYGIEFDRDDGETPLRYHHHPNEEWIPAAEIQHRKLNVDLGSPRGAPTFYPVRKNLRRAEKMLRNMSHVIGIQASIALIRKHANATKQNIQAFTDSLKDFTKTDPQTQRQVTYQDLHPGTIVDANSNTEHEFPGTGIDPSKIVPAIQAELRAVASRVVMPEFMMTSDASNANYSSTLVAEGPAVKMFERLQQSTIEDDMLLIEMELSLKMGGVTERIEVQAEPPNIISRDELQCVQANSILKRDGIISDQTYSARHGLDYEQEQDNIDEHNDKLGIERGEVLNQQVMQNDMDQNGNSEQN